MSSMNALTQIVDILTPLPAEERARVIRAALVMLGDSALPLDARDQENKDEISKDIPPRARAWMKQYAITAEQLQEVFHLSDGAIEVIAANLPGRNKKEQTYSAYILAGIGQLLLNGAPIFDDKTARSLCEAAGCYDVANHATSLKGKGNEFSGSKDKGWALTAPGLKRGADLIKDMNKQLSEK